MTPIKDEFEGLKQVVLKGDGCLDLPLNTDGGACVITWELTKEEVEELVRTQRLYLVIYHPPNQFPPLRLTTDKPPVYVDETKTQETTEE